MPNVASAFVPRAFIAADRPISPPLLFPESELTTVAMVPPQVTDAMPSLAIGQEGVGSDPTAFTDEISLLDGPIQTMLLAAVAVMAVLVAIKSLGGAMDNAIGKVLEDFEETMKGTYPKRWEPMESELEGLEEPQRSEKLFKLMESMKTETPDFYDDVIKKMAKR
eukprot:CAMPEP_0113526870 /NCGR_PEP_ID=MMETSP0015_2-20120614/982_1 /TAXON_ID=2838 /ORGANISM="Odontella" /LENGTH=164 /DNA_ID=CAMNT_0000425245 /DNA_START=169 /DNA_END=663 /DNA_ORIENTATION=+ /assembly_acc=CAM_ASM_000160